MLKETALPTDTPLPASQEPRKYNHAEAFCHMIYESKDKRHREVIWNSRDGVTPFGIDSLSHKTLYHVEWNRDRCDPTYKPQPGDRIFVDATRELLQASAERYVQKYWNADQYPMNQHPFFEKMTPGEAVLHFLAEWCKPGSPTIVTVQPDGSYKHD